MRKRSTTTDIKDIKVNETLKMENTPKKKQKKQIFKHKILLGVWSQVRVG